MLVAERIAKSVTDPKRFLEWYLGLWESGGKIPENFEDCVEKCLRNHGAEEVNFLLFYNRGEIGYIKVEAGVQTFTAEEPVWMGALVDCVGWNGMKSRAAVVIQLVTLIEADAINK